MKKTIYILLSIAAAVACSKTEVAYDDALTGEISISPVAGNITKAAIDGETFPTTDHIALFAFHNPAQTATDVVSDYVAFEQNEYLNDAEFHYNNQTDKQGAIAWSGLNSIYYWPITGSLVFAGHSLPAPATTGQASSSIGTVTYDLTDDYLKIAGYKQSTDTDVTFDLLYFGRDGKSYNNRREGTSVPIKFNHALSWITIEVKGEAGALVSGREWSITDLTIQGVNTYADFEFKGTAAGTAEDPKIKWTVKDSDDAGDEVDVADMIVYSNNTGKQLTSEYVDIEQSQTVDRNVVAKKGIVVIPQPVKSLSVTIKYKSPAGDDIEETFPVELSTNAVENWEAGKHYTYQLKFSPEQILVTPTINGWNNN